MKKSIRIMSMLLMLLMLVTTVSLVSCSNKTDDGETTTTAAGVDDQTTAKPESKYDIGDNIPETLKYGGETIPIVSRSNKWVVDEVTVENNDGGLINSAVVKRNKIVEERLGVKIENTLVDGNNYAISDLIRNQAQTDHLYDIFVNSVYSTIMYTAENHFANLKELQYLDLSRPYWSQGFNEAASIGDKQYFCHRCRIALDIPLYIRYILQLGYVQDDPRDPESLRYRKRSSVDHRLSDGDRVKVLEGHGRQSPYQ